MPDDAPDISSPASAPEARRLILPKQPVEVEVSVGALAAMATESTETPGTADPTDVAESNSASPRGRWQWTQDPVVRQTSMILTIGGLIAAVVALVVGYGPMTVRAGELRAAPVRVAIDWPPLAGQVDTTPVRPGDAPRTWVNQETRDTLEALVRKTMSENPVDREALERTRLALVRTGWFNSNLRVERLPDGLVHVGSAAPEGAVGLWRFPVAAVRYAGKDHLVGTSGELLALSYDPDASGMHVIVGVRSAPPALGEAWLGGEVQAGLKLLTYLQAHPTLRVGTSGGRQLAAVDVSQFTPGKQLSIITERGNKVLWGGPIGELNPGQVSDAAKRDRLVMLLRDYGRIDAGHGTVDLRIEGNVFVVDTTQPEPASAPAGSTSKNPGASRNSGRRQQASGDRR